jgi:hypothetical protein
MAKEISVSMNTYTMSVAKADGVEQIVARGVTALRALNVALEYDGAGRAVVAANLGAAHILWELLRPRTDGGREKVMAALTLRTSDYLSDAQDAYVEFEKIFLGDVRAFWHGGFERDDEYDRRHAARSA